MPSEISKALCLLARELNESRRQRSVEFEWIKSHFGFATKHDLKSMETRIMTKISEFAAKQSAHNDRMDAAVAGVQGDVKTLNDLIEKLQTTQGEITPEDQALLDQLEARGDAIAAKLEALDAITPPPVPPPV